MEKISAVGFIVHAYRDARRERINILGRLSDGRSFAATFPLPELLLCVRDSDRLRVGEIVARKKTSVSVEDSAYRLFDGSVCARIACANRNEHERFSRMLKAESIESFGGDMKDAVCQHR